MNKNSGFTLIELLVVISIISLLSSAAVFSLNNARIKARDARRVSDIKQIALAVQMFYDQTGGFPICADENVFVNGKTDCLSSQLIAAGIMKEVPVDPKFAGRGWGYDYNYLDCCGDLFMIRSTLEGKTFTLNSDYPDGTSCDTGIYPTATWYSNAIYGGYGPSCETLSFQLGDIK